MLVSKIPAAISHPSLLTDCQVALAVTSGLSRTARPVGRSLTATNAQDQVTSERGGPSPYIGLSSHGYYYYYYYYYYFIVHRNCIVNKLFPHRTLCKHCYEVEQVTRRTETGLIGMSNSGNLIAGSIVSRIIHSSPFHHSLSPSLLEQLF
jgi:hypothetical protein